MLDITKTTEAKSDQLNADDLIGSPKTITVTKVSMVPGDQPVIINYEGDEGKPYKPCKGMRRALVAGWGKDAELFTGRRMTLINNPEVTWGGKEVGGIQISHMSHIEKTLKFPLAMSRAKKVIHKIEPLQTEAPAPSNPLSDEDFDGWCQTFDACETMAELSEIGKAIKEKNYDQAGNKELGEKYKEAQDRIRGN